VDGIIPMQTFSGVNMDLNVLKDEHELLSQRIDEIRSQIKELEQKRVEELKDEVEKLHHINAELRKLLTSALGFHD
jgi:archaellum component FlaC